MKLIFRPTTNLHVLHSNQLQIGVFHHWEVFGSVNKNAAAYFVRYPGLLASWKPVPDIQMPDYQAKYPTSRLSGGSIIPYAVPVPSKKKLQKYSRRVNHSPHYFRGSLIQEIFTIFLRFDDKRFGYNFTYVCCRSNK